MNKTADPKQSRSLPDLISLLDQALRENWIGTGDVAELKRLDVEAPDQPAFWKIMSRWVAGDSWPDAEAESNWATILRGMARMPDHRPGRRVGWALAEADYSELRLMRLIRSRGASLRAAVLRAAHFLSTKAEALDWTEMTAVLLTRDPDKAEELRRRIAQDYYGSIERKEETR